MLTPSARSCERRLVAGGEDHQRAPELHAVPTAQHMLRHQLTVDVGAVRAAQIHQRRSVRPATAARRGTARPPCRAAERCCPSRGRYGRRGPAAQTACPGRVPGSQTAKASARPVTAGDGCHGLRLQWPAELGLARHGTRSRHSMVEFWPSTRRATRVGGSPSAQSTARFYESADRNDRVCARRVDRPSRRDRRRFPRTTSSARCSAISLS